MIEAFLERGMFDLRVSMPGQVESYDDATELASIKPLLSPTIVDEDGNEETVDLDVIRNVPIEFPGCGDWFIKWPIAKGDTVRLTFHDFSLDAWIKQGGKQVVKDLRTHHLSDATAWPGLRATPTAIGAVASDKMVLGHRNGTQILISDALVLLGGAAASSFVALASLCNAEFTKIATALGQIATLLNATAGPVLSAPGTVTPYLRADVDATKVKAL